MKILLVADKESPYLWDHYQPGRLKDIDLILSSGDLKAEYLSFLVTMCTAPLFYVHGNHDVSYMKHPPEGCTCIDDKIVTFGGLRIMGMGGCMLYSGKDHQYSDEQMERRLKKMRFALHRSKGVDLLLTHAPAQGLGDNAKVGVTLASGTLTKTVFGSYNFEGKDNTYTLTKGDASLSTF